MRSRSLFIVVSLAAMLVLAVVGALRMWSSIGDSGLNGDGTTALIIGAIGSLILGGGLMALVFFSSRRGYDDRADPGKHTGETSHEP